MSQDTFAPLGEQPVSGGSAASGRTPVDRVELKRQWVHQEEEQQVEEALAMYAKAARQRLQSGAPVTPERLSEEELEVRSQELKLQQKCQDIAAQILVDELEELDDEEDM